MTKIRNYIFIFIVIILVIILSIYAKYSWDQIILGEEGIDIGKFGDSFGAFNILISTLTLVLVGVTYFSQKDALDEQTKGIKNQNFRSFIEFLLEGITHTIDNFQVRGNNTQSLGMIKGESVILGIKHGYCFFEGQHFSGIDKSTWLKHGGLNQLYGIIKDIKFIEEYIEENYKGKDNERKEYYYRLIKNRVSFNLYERILEEETKESAMKLSTFKTYLEK